MFWLIPQNNLASIQCHHPKCYNSTHYPSLSIGISAQIKPTIFRHKK
jgi:hypothetical protein